MRFAAWLRRGVTLSLLCAGTAVAADAGATTLEDVLTAVRQRSPDIMAATTQARATRASRVGATPLFHANPSITGGAGAVARFDEPPLRGGLGGAGTIQLNVPVELAGQRWLRVASVDAHATADDLAVDDVARQLRAHAVELFARALFAQRATALAQQNLELTQRVASAAQQRLAAGAVGAVEVELAALGVTQARQALATALATQRATLANLGGLMGVDSLTAVTGELRPARALPALDTVLQAAAQRADVRAARARGGAAQRDASLAAAEAVPSPTFGTMYQYWNREHAVMGTVTFPLPVFTRGQGEEARARTQASGMLQEADARARMAQAEARAAYALLVSLAQQRSEFSDDTGAALLARLEAAHQARGVTLDVLLDAQRRVMATRRDALELELQEALAWIALDAAMGVLP